MTMPDPILVSSHFHAASNTRTGRTIFSRKRNLLMKPRHLAGVGRLLAKTPETRSFNVENRHIGRNFFISLRKSARGRLMSTIIAASPSGLPQIPRRRASWKSSVELNFELALPRQYTPTLIIARKYTISHVCGEYYKQIITETRN